VNSLGADVSLLVINAGQLSKGQLIEVSSAEAQSLLDVNMY